jgi:hypothetical protein
VPLQSLHIYYREYSTSVNPPILHRKEEFVSEDFPTRTKFERLTKQEEKWGLFDSQSTIGNKQDWEALLSSRGVKLVGHRLTRRRPE